MNNRKRVPCPSCRAEGRDSRGNHLLLYEDGSAGWCFHERKMIKLEGAHVENRSKGGFTRDSVNVQIVNSYPIRDMSHRKITQSTMERFGVRSEIDEMDGTVKAVYYPYHDHDGTVVGYKKRTLPKEFSVVGKIKGLFGQAQCKNNAKLLILVEGEHDCLAGWEILKKKGKAWNICSLPNGANEEGTLDTTTLKELEWIVKHEKVLLMLDNDAPGKATAKALADALCSQTSVAIASLPRKDTGKCLEDGIEDDWFNCIYGCKAYHPEEIVEGKDLDFTRLRKAKKPGVEMPFPKLQKMTWGLRKGEITLVTAASGIGKSTFVKELAYHVAKSGHSIANIALETQMEDVAMSYIAMDNNVPAYRYIFNTEVINDEDYEASVDWMFRSNRMHFFKHWGSINPDTLRAKMLYFAKVLKVDFIVLDHVSMVIAGNESDNERKDIDKLFEAMTQICVETGVGILPIIHLKRVQGKKLNHGDEVELTDLRGSAGAEQMSFNVWALERNQQGDDKDLVKIRVLKNRSIGFTGLADTLQYNHETGRLKLFGFEEFENNEDRH